MSEFKRPIEEDYGPSKIRLEKLDMTKGFDSIKLNGLDVILPVLNLKKYDANAECYAFIETLENSPITMVDILYSYEDILDKFEHNERFRREFLKAFSRRKINISSLISPALTVIPGKANVAKKFAETLKLSLQDSMGIQVRGISQTKHSIIIAINEQKNYSWKKREKNCRTKEKDSQIYVKKRCYNNEKRSNDCRIRSSG